MDKTLKTFHLLVALDADGLVRVAHHGDEHVQQDDHIAGDVAAEHEKSPEPGEILDAGQLKVAELDKTEDRPEESLRRFKEVRESPPDEASRLFGSEAHLWPAFLPLQLCIVPQQLVEPTGEGKENEEAEANPLEDVHHHPAQADLEGTQVRVDTKNLYNLQEARDHARPKEPL